MSNFLVARTRPLRLLATPKREMRSEAWRARAGHTSSSGVGVTRRKFEGFESRCPRHE
jgi:hypothetical protein